MSGFLHIELLRKSQLIQCVSMTGVLCCLERVLGKEVFLQAASRSVLQNVVAKTLRSVIIPRRGHKTRPEQSRATLRNVCTTAGNK